jgi:hypothetical protein
VSQVDSVLQNDADDFLINQQAEEIYDAISCIDYFAHGVLPGGEQKKLEQLLETKFRSIRTLRNLQNDSQEQHHQDMSGLQLDTEETETYRGDSSPLESWRNRGEYRGKKKQRPPHDKRNEWSEWVWDSRTTQYYRTKEIAPGKYMYEYNDPAPQAAHDRSHFQSDPSADSYYTTYPGTHGTQDSSKVEVVQSPGFSEPQSYGAGAPAQSAGASGESHSYGASPATAYSEHKTADEFSPNSSESFPSTSHLPANYPANSYLPTSNLATSYPQPSSPPTSYLPPTTTPSFTSGYSTMYQSGPPATSSSYSAGAPGSLSIMPLSSLTSISVY